MKEKYTDEKKGKTRPVGYRVPVELLDKFAEICDRDGLDHQAQMRMMLGAWIGSREAGTTGAVESTPKRQIIKTIDATGSAVNISRRKREDVRG